MKPPPVLAAAEIAQMLGLSRQRVTQLSAKPDFPVPIATLSVGKIWAYDDIKAWAEQTGRSVHRLATR